MPRGSRANENRLGFTAVEVLASTVLAVLLMTALLGTLRALRVQETLLDARLPRPAWQTPLEAALRSDLERSIECSASPEALRLRGYAGASAETGEPNWRPAEIVYEVRRGRRGASWLVRRIEGNPASANLALAGVDAIRVGLGGAAAAADPRPRPIADGFQIEFWENNASVPKFRLEFRKL